MQICQLQDSFLTEQMRQRTPVYPACAIIKSNQDKRAGPSLNFDELLSWGEGALFWIEQTRIIILWLLNQRQKLASKSLYQPLRP